MFFTPFSIFSSVLQWELTEESRSARTFSDCWFTEWALRLCCAVALWLVRVYDLYYFYYYYYCYDLCFFVCLQFEPLDRVVVDIPFLLMTDILSSSPWPLLLHSSSLQLLTMTSNTAQLQSQLQEGTWLISTVIIQRLFRFTAVIKKWNVNPMTITYCVCLSVCLSGSADRRVCQWVFLSPVSASDQQQ